MRISKRLQAHCVDLLGAAVFQASSLAAVTSSEFDSIPMDIKQHHLSLSRPGNSRGSATSPGAQPADSRKGELKGHSQPAHLRSVSAGEHRHTPVSSWTSDVGIF
jgi:hypothetical protein